ncbi:MAG: YcjF family protein [Rubrimonas sp.]|uniref:YcjF family protein n=1 Tax=Rubrimonas sp. TaxID=2036015 RepID=UPI002FDE6B3C
MTRTPRRPVVFDADDPALGAPAPDPGDAPEIGPEIGAEGRDALAGEPAGLRAARLAARPSSALARWFWSAALALVGLATSVALYDFVAGLIARNAILGWVALGLTAALAAALVVFALREAAAVARLGRVDALRAQAARARESGDARAAQATLKGLRRLYAGRRDMDWALADLARAADQPPEAEALLDAAERALMRDLDARAAAAAGRAARTVAAATALIPLALVDVLAALTANLRMIREIAEIYGGRAGWLGSWKLLKAVAAHLVATGAVAVGDDLIGPAIGGGVLARLSRRFGEGLINGALTARVGAAAIAVCRPLPFAALPRPTGRGLAAAALKGLMR